jgi:hypothetical protein
LCIFVLFTGLNDNFYFCKNAGFRLFDKPARMGGKNKTLRNEYKLQKEFIMNKKILGIAVILLMVIAVGIAFAADNPTLKREATSVTVTNTDRRNAISGDICIYLIHKNGKNKETDNFPYNLKPGASTTYRIPANFASDWTIYDASAISCFVIPE